jgi:hypothetical protein
MANHTVTIELDDEQEAALSELVSEFNAQNGTAYANGDLLAALALGNIAERVRVRYAKALQDLGDAAAALPYAQRQALMAQVAAAIGG